MTPLASRAAATKADLARRLLDAYSARDWRAIDILAPAFAALLAACEDPMPFEDFRPRPFVRLNCQQWRHGGTQRHAALAAARRDVRRAEANRGRYDRAWQVAREHRISFAEAYASLFGDE